MTTTTERADQGAGLSAGSVEIRSIDYVPESERHGKPWHLGPGVVPGQRPALDARRRGDRRGRWPEPDLVDDRDHPRNPDRHAVHGVPLGSGPEAGSAADDPVARAVRLLRGAAAGDRRRAAVHRLQRLQHGPRRSGHPGAVPQLGQGRRIPAGGHPVAGADDLRLPADPYRAAVGHLVVHRRLRRVHDRRAIHAPGAPRCVRPGQLPRGALPPAVRRGGQLPAHLGPICFGVFALPAARNTEPDGLLVDLLGLGDRRDHPVPRRRVHPVGRHNGRAGRPGPRRGQQGLRRLRHDHHDLLAPRAGRGYRDEHVQRRAFPR